MSPIINVPDEYNKTPDPTQYGDTIQLPFTAPLISWRNGNVAYKPEDGALYYGGWECSADRLEIAYTQDGYQPLVAFGTARSITSREGHVYQAYVARSLAVLPIATRRMWVVDEHKPGDKGRGWDQILVYLADRTEKDKKSVLIPWGPAVLSAKGLSAKNLQDAFKVFAKETAAARKEFAGNAKPWLFYHVLGTFANEPEIERVGPKGQQSPITPCRCGLPVAAKINEAFLTFRYPGDEILAICSDLRTQAQEWLSAWKSDRSTKPSDPTGLANDQEPEMPEEPPFDTDNFPF
jgi:hypothetical protein